MFSQNMLHFHKPFPSNAPLLFYSYTPTSQNKIDLKAAPVRHEAFFCLMEDKLYKKLNFWIKFRAGSDEIYRGMIAKPRDE